MLKTHYYKHYEYIYLSPPILLNFSYNFILKLIDYLFNDEINIRKKIKRKEEIAFNIILIEKIINNYIII